MVEPKTGGPVYRQPRPQRLHRRCASSIPRHLRDRLRAGRANSPRSARPGGPSVCSPRPVDRVRRISARSAPSSPIVGPLSKESLAAAVTRTLTPSGPPSRRSSAHASPRTTFEIWLAPLRLRRARRRTPGRSRRPPSSARWVAERFAAPCCAAAARPSWARRRRSRRASRRRRRPERRRRARPPPAGERPRAAARPDDDRLNPKFTFEQFVIGDANRFAHAAALAVAELPGQAYNPLFIYGPPGVGKTHLLHSIGNYVQRVRRRADRPLHDGRALHQRVRRRAPAQRRRARSRRRYRRNDVLLIDDVQFLESQGQDRGGVLPHLQRAARGRQPARPDLRPPAARHRRASRTACASASSPASSTTSPRRTSPPASTVLRKRVHHDGIELADDGVLELLAERVDDEHPRARGRADPRRRLRLADATHRSPPRSPSAVLDRLDAAAPAAAGRVRGAQRRPSSASRPSSPSRSASTRDELVSPEPRRARHPARARSRCTSRASTPAHSLPAIGGPFGGRDHTHRAARLQAHRRAHGRATPRLDDDRSAVDRPPPPDPDADRRA